MTLPKDYFERVYAGVLGKMIGVYLGRPFEGWNYEQIIKKFGEIDRYVHDVCDLPLIVTDDDLSGTFTFIRALEDHDEGRDIRAAQIGQTWLNYVINRRTIFWWGGLGNSTEHTAYIRLKQGYEAPESGSIETNGKIVAEQIGAQIFIDGWGMVAPGDPELAAELAKRAASVSHDGEAIYGAQIIAIMESLAFIEEDRFKLLDAAVNYIPSTSIIYQLIQGLREQYEKEADWRKTREWIVKHYGYDKYLGACHIVPNHALIIMGLLYGDDDFSKSLMITNTSGWDTDCNSANIGCLLGIKLGLEGIDQSSYDWRTPVSDRLLLPTADGSNAITDGLREAIRITNIGRTLEGDVPIKPKEGARFSFALPGSVQGFRIEQNDETETEVDLKNVKYSAESNQRMLKLKYPDLNNGKVTRVSTPTFILPDEINMPGYKLYASPTLYSGQLVRARVVASETNVNDVSFNVFFRCYDENDKPKKINDKKYLLSPGTSTQIKWKIPNTDGKAIYEIGIEINAGNSTGSLNLDWLTWSGAPEIKFKALNGSGEMWRSVWINAVDQWEKWGAAYRIIQNQGRGMISTGTSEWQDYRVSVPLTVPMGKVLGIGARVQGLNRFYGLLLFEDNKLKLIKTQEDGDRILAEIEFKWELWEKYDFQLSVKDEKITGSINGAKLLEAIDEEQPYKGGGVALIVHEGHLLANEVLVEPI